MLSRFTYELKQFKDSLEIKEFYPGKNLYEAKAKKEYGNKAYKEGKDLDALYHYSQVLSLGATSGINTSGRVILYFISQITCFSPI